MKPISLPFSCPPTSTLTATLDLSTMPEPNTISTTSVSTTNASLLPVPLLILLHFNQLQSSRRLALNPTPHTMKGEGFRV